jgi:hypothetical protein
VRPEPERTEQTVAIGAAVFLLIGLLLATLAALWALDTFTETVDGKESTIFDCAAIASVVISVAYLARSTAPR